MRRPLLCCLAVLIGTTGADAQQNPDGQLPVTSFVEPYPFLIRDPVVHDDLRLDKRQRGEIAALSDELDTALWAMRNKSAVHIANTLRQTTETAQQRISEILTSEQRKRLGEIELWALGMKAFLRDDVAERLRITEKQRTRIRAIMSEIDAGLTQLAKEARAGGELERLQRKARKLQVDKQKQILRVLSRVQQKTWIARLGRRIDVSKLGRIKFKAPELQGQEGWINSEPLTLAQLKGKVIALHFYTFG